MTKRRRRWVGCVGTLRSAQSRTQRVSGFVIPSPLAPTYQRRHPSHPAITSRRKFVKVWTGRVKKGDLLNPGEESIAESWPVGKVRFLETFALSRCRARAGTRQHFPRPATFDPQACSNHAFGISQAVQPGKLRLIFAREVATGSPALAGASMAASRSNA